MKFFKNKRIGFVCALIFIVLIWGIWRVYPQSSIQLEQVQRKPQAIFVDITSPKDFGTRGYFEINSILYCSVDENLELKSDLFMPTGKEYYGLINKTPAPFDEKQQKYLYHIEIELDGLQQHVPQNKTWQCRVMTGHYLRGFIRSNVIQFKL